MSTLKLLVGHWGSTVLCQVIEQDESLRALGASGAAVDLYFQSGFSITSANGPQLRSEALYVRGSEHSLDDLRFSCKCDTAKDAAKLIAIVERAVAEVNAKSWDVEITEHTVPLRIVE